MKIQLAVFGYLGRAQRPAPLTESLKEELFRKPGTRNRKLIFMPTAYCIFLVIAITDKSRLRTVKIQLAVFGYLGRAQRPAPLAESLKEELFRKPGTRNRKLIFLPTAHCPLPTESRLRTLKIQLAVFGYFGRAQRPAPLAESLKEELFRKPGTRNREPIFLPTAHCPLPTESRLRTVKIQLAVFGYLGRAQRPAPLKEKLFRKLETGNRKPIFLSTAHFIFLVRYYKGIAGKIARPSTIRVQIRQAVRWAKKRFNWWVKVATGKFWVLRVC